MKTALKKMQSIRAKVDSLPKRKVKTVRAVRNGSDQFDLAIKSIGSDDDVAQFFAGGWRSMQWGR